MKTPVSFAYVSHVGGDYITLVTPTKDARKIAAEVSVKPRSSTPQRTEYGYSNDRDLAQLFAILRDAGVVFGGAPAGWPPSAVFEDLREKGLLNGSFTEVTWTEPHAPELVTK